MKKPREVVPGMLSKDDKASKQGGIYADDGGDTSGGLCWGVKPDFSASVHLLYLRHVEKVAPVSGGEFVARPEIRSGFGFDDGLKINFVPVGACS